MNSALVDFFCGHKWRTQANLYRYFWRKLAKLAFGLNMSKQVTRSTASNYFTLAIARQTTGFTRDQLNKLSYRAPYFEQTVELIHSHKKFHGNTSNIFRSPRNILELWISGLFLLPLRIPATTLHKMTDKTILV